MSALSLESTTATASAISLFAELCSAYSSRGRWPDGIEAACTELLSAVISDRSLLELVSPFDALTAGHLLQHRGEFDHAATFLSRAYCGDADLRDSDEFRALEHIDRNRWPHLLQAASCGNRRQVHDILFAGMRDVFSTRQGPGRPLDGAGSTSRSHDAASAGEPATTIINDAAVIEYVAARLLELQQDVTRMRLSFHSALWFAQQFLARRRAQPLISEAAESRDEGPIFPSADVLFDSVVAAAATLLPHSAVEADRCVELALLAAVSVASSKSVDELRQLAGTDPLWLMSESGGTIPFEVLRSVPPPEIIDSVAAERDRLEKFSLLSAVKCNRLLVVERLSGTFEAICHVETSAVDESELLPTRPACGIYLYVW